MFCAVRKIQFSELMGNGRVGLCTLLNYFQDIATEHTETLGYGMTRLTKEGLAWILRTMNISVNRYPCYGESVYVSTWTTGYDRMFGNRSFEIVDGEGKRVAVGASLWALVDMVKKKPVRVNDEIISLYGITNNQVLEYIRRSPDLGECTPTGEFKVLKRDIDTNNHVNNVKFIEFATEFLPEGSVVKGMEVLYRRAAYYADIIRAYTCKGEKSFGVRLENPLGEEHTSIKFAI